MAVPLLQGGLKMNVYCLGDSNTYGYDPRSPLGDRYDHTWPELLGEAAGVCVCSDGVNGRSIADVCRSYDLLSGNLRAQKPDLLIILLGSNDILMDGLTDPQIIAGRMEALIQKLRKDFESLPIFLLSPPQIRIPGPWPETAKALTGHYQSLAQKYGLRFLALPNLSLPLAYDGVHLSAVHQIGAAYM